MSLGNPSKRNIKESPPFWDGGDEEESYRVVLVSNDRAKDKYCQHLGSYNEVPIEEV